MVLRALEHLGVIAYFENDKHVLIARMPRKASLTKWHVSKELELHLMHQLGIDAVDYANALRMTERDDQGEAPGQPSAGPAGSDEVQGEEISRCLALVRERCQHAFANGDASIELHLDELALLRAAREDRDQLHLKLEIEVHAVMKQHRSAAEVQLTLPGCEPFKVGRPGYDD